MFAELKKLTNVCQELKQEMLEHERSRDEMHNAIEVLEHKVCVLEEENTILKDENRKIAYFTKGLDREIENVVAYLEKQQDE